MNPFATAARDAGRALGDLGAGEENALVEEIARALAETAAEPPRRPARARRKSGPRDPAPDTGAEPE